jgi:hypothetical protein
MGFLFWILSIPMAAFGTRICMRSMFEIVIDGKKTTSLRGVQLMMPAQSAEDSRTYQSETFNDQAWVTHPTVK